MACKGCKKSSTKKSTGKTTGRKYSCGGKLKK